MTNATRQVLVALLAEPARPHHGYEILKAIGIKAGSLYPILDRLEREGWIEGWSEPSPIEGRSTGRYYRLTGLGTARGEGGHTRREGGRVRPTRPSKGTAVGTILIAITGFVGMVAITVTLTAIKAVVEKEYDGWAPLLSRALVRLSGRLCPPRAAEFEDHYAVARDEGNTGMMGAVAAIVWSVRVWPRCVRSPGAHARRRTW